jgi:tetratricopeptide (TPR) repeat protein
MADSGSGRALAPIGGQVPSGGAAGSSVPIGLRYGSGVSSHGIPRGISVWPDAQAPYGGGPDPIGPAGPGDPLDRSGWVEGLEASADTAQLGSEEFEPALGVIEAPHPMEDLADQLASTGRLQLSQGEIYLAEASLSNAVALFTSDPIMRIEYALALAAVGNFAGARTELIDGFRMQPELVVESLNVVSAYGGEELFLERMEQIDRYRESVPLDSDSLFVRAFLAFHAGALEAAREDFLLLRSNDPKFPFLSAFTKQLELLDLTKPSEPRQPAEPAQGDPDGEAGDDPDGEAGEDPAKASGGPDR